MKSKLSAIALFTLCYLLMSAAFCLADVTPLPLEESDCIKCHRKVIAQVAANGGRHHTEVGCNDCHLEHPPMGKNAIPKCSMCHAPQDRKHFTLKDCTSCHNPHSPKVVNFDAGKKLRVACVSCHPNPGSSIEKYPSAHTELDCTDCHTVHGEFYNCDVCHTPKENKHFKIKNCKSCHDPHAPTHMDLAAKKNVKPACLTCHEGPGKEMQEAPSAHAELDCNYCHREHAKFLDCLQCHKGHSPEMTYKDCLDCHAPHKPRAILFEKQVSSNSCSGCHEDVVKDVESAGAAHKTEVSCQDCHRAHPPAEEGVIPACADCHSPETKAHYALKNCTSCHNPHKPLTIDFGAVPNVRPGCASCHNAEDQAMTQMPSRHSAMDCKDCHLVHAERLECLTCHEPHRKGMTFDECLACHPVHTPTVIKYAATPKETACASCHQPVVKEVDEKGLSHKTAVACIDCHTAHPGVGCRECHVSQPDLGGPAIPRCSNCHAPADKPHYTLEACTGCHKPHAPEVGDLVGLTDIKAACVTCHPKPGELLDAIPSAHTELDCNECHNVHGEYIDCLGCHEGHSPEMTYQQCLQCHNPHQPTAIVYGTKVEADFCASCHDDVVALVAEKGEAHKHSTACIDCHTAHPPAPEGVIPECAQCHRRTLRPHYAVENCTSCHDPHAPLDINYSQAKLVKDACLSCHNEQGAEMSRHPSKHAGLDCKECHQSHKTWLQCMECHQGHTENMRYQDCLACHKPHMPTAIDFSKDQPSSFCAPCHEGPYTDIKEQGARHKTDVSCQDCHMQHPPAKDGVIPACALCHAPQDAPHFKVSDCEGCHQPHSPLKMDFSQVKEVKPACASCHSPIAQQLVDFPSKHSALDCKACHQQHGQFQKCLECHEGHSKNMTYEDCLACHQPHKPLQVNYSEKLPSEFCGSCHDEVAANLHNFTTKHSALACVYCHPGTHKAIQSCQVCHGEPHDADLHVKFPDCLNCHNNPHKLADWKK